MMWEKVPVETLTKVVTKGTTPTSVGYQFSTEGIPFLRVNNIQDDCIDLSDVLFINSDTDLALKRSRILPNDVLISIAGTIGRSAVVPEDAPLMNCNQAVAIIRLHESTNTHFFRYWLNSQDAINQISDLKVTATISNLSLGCINKLKISLPPLEEQKRIAAILDKADRVRRKRQEAIRLTEELGRSIFLDMFGDPVTNPKGWEKVPLSKIVKGDMRNGLSPSTKGSYHGNVLTLAAVTQGFFRSNEYKSGMFDVNPPENKKVHRSDFLVCRGNGNINLVGRACFPDQNYQDILFSDTIIGVPVDMSIINQSFLQAVWNSSLVRSQIEQQACTTNGRYKINQTTLKNIKILLPPFSLQSKFGATFESINSIKIKFSLLISENLFNSLLQRAFRGEL